MQLALFIAIMEVPTSVAIIQVLMFYCNYVGGTFWDTYVMLVDLFVGVMKVTVSVPIMQLDLFIGDAFHVLPSTHYQAILLYITFFLQVYFLHISLKAHLSK